MTVIRWILALTLALFFLYMGAQKFGTNNIIFATIADRSGIALFEPQIRVMTGVVEIFAALMLTAPKLRTNGARVALLLLVGAIGFHLSPWLGISVEGMGNSLFMMAIGATILALAVLFLEHLATKK